VPPLTAARPLTPVETVTEILHSVPVSDPYRWLENQNSPQTREWIREQTRYARAYLGSIPGRERIRQRIREFLAVESHDSVQKVANRYIFRKRLPNQEQPSIYMREAPDGEDQLLVDPAAFRKGVHTAVKPLRMSRDGRFLLYEIKQGGERSGTFAVLDIDNRKMQPDILPRGYLRGFAFAADGKSFLYVHEPLELKRPLYRAAYRHLFGTGFDEDEEIFCAGEDSNTRLGLIADAKRVGFLVHRLGEKAQTNFYLKPFESNTAPELIVADAEYSFVPTLAKDRLLALTDRSAPNLRIVELRLRPPTEPKWVDVVPEVHARIQQWLVSGDHILVCYVCAGETQLLAFDLEGKQVGEIEIPEDETVRLVRTLPQSDEVFLERESFTKPISVWRYSPTTGQLILWSERRAPLDGTHVTHTVVTYEAKDGASIPMYLVGRRNVLASGCHPAILTSYGGYGVPMTPQFSVFVAFLVERGCLFALPQIRGGSDFGSAWYEAAKRRKRQTAYDDFLAAAEWLIRTGRTKPNRLAIFGGSNSGLLAGVVMTQRPDLFRAVVCMVPMLDMLRYHLFDDAGLWRDEFGTADDPEDFTALRQYSPYHNVHKGLAYPAVMFVSGDADQNCNPMHARKMTARLQAATTSEHPVILDYSEFRGHSPVLPLSERINALTDRLAFLCDQIQLST